MRGHGQYWPTIQSLFSLTTRVDITRRHDRHFGGRKFRPCGHAAARAEAAPARQAGRACRLSSLESAKRSEPRRNFWISLHWRRRRGVVLDDAVLQFRRPGAGAASFLPWTYGRTELREDNLAHNLLLHPAPRSSLLRSPFGACTHPSIHPSFTPSTSLIL